MKDDKIKEILQYIRDTNTAKLIPGESFYLNPRRSDLTMQYWNRPAGGFALVGAKVAAGKLPNYANTIKAAKFKKPIDDADLTKIFFKYPLEQETPIYSDETHKHHMINPNSHLYASGLLGHAIGGPTYDIMADMINQEILAIRDREPMMENLKKHYANKIYQRLLVEQDPQLSGVKLRVNTSPTQTSLTPSAVSVVGGAASSKSLWQRAHQLIQNTRVGQQIDRIPNIGRILKYAREIPAWIGPVMGFVNDAGAKLASTTTGSTTGSRDTPADYMTWWNIGNNFVQNAVAAQTSKAIMDLTRPSYDTTRSDAVARRADELRRPGNHVPYTRPRATTPGQYEDQLRRQGVIPAISTPAEARAIASRRTDEDLLTMYPSAYPGGPGTFPRRRDFGPNINPADPLAGRPGVPNILYTTSPIEIVGAQNARSRRILDDLHQTMNAGQPRPRMYSIGTKSTVKHSGTIMTTAAPVEMGPGPLRIPEVGASRIVRTTLVPNRGLGDLEVPDAVTRQGTWADTGHPTRTLLPGSVANGGNISRLRMLDRATPNSTIAPTINGVPARASTETDLLTSGGSYRPDMSLAAVRQRAGHAQAVGTGAADARANRYRNSPIDGEGERISDLIARQSHILADAARVAGGAGFGGSLMAAAPRLAQFTFEHPSWAKATTLALAAAYSVNNDRNREMYDDAVIFGSPYKAPRGLPSQAHKYFFPVPQLSPLQMTLIAMGLRDFPMVVSDKSQSQLPTNSSMDIDLESTMDPRVNPNNKRFISR